jgi:hypothetical protein
MASRNFRAVAARSEISLIALPLIFIVNSKKNLFLIFFEGKLFFPEQLCWLGSYIQTKGNAIKLADT